ncbi:hypothetical protein N825_01610 [Skermanella stibiiresistens SB22]|uniref:Cyclase dehydrase n=1 Tax=Skermanella stibiiresistens SB22 TaxID=1385369 RepID=W9H9J7_9PROT|nr:hypothetical protein [Skermanella stibiiresistens]EWY42604.1 hypothetical protein N825_01610 [Skermanella stibiiresistens SB22]
MNYLSNIARSEGDPKVIRSGPSSLGSSDRLAKGLGWFSIGLGLAGLIAPRRITRSLGMEGQEAIVRAFGAREIGTGIVSLSVDKRLGLWSRVAGDALDIATLTAAMGRDNPKRDNVQLALAMVLGVTALDVIGARALGSRHEYGRGERRSYRDRSGFPKGIQAARGMARDFGTPSEPRAMPTLASVSEPAPPRQALT